MSLFFSFHFPLFLGGVGGKGEMTPRLLKQWQKGEENGKMDKNEEHEAGSRT